MPPWLPGAGKRWLRGRKPKVGSADRSCFRRPPESVRRPSWPTRGQLPFKTPCHGYDLALRLRPTYGIWGPCRTSSAPFSVSLHPVPTGIILVQSMRCSNSCVSLKKKYIIYKTVSGTNLRGNRGWDAMTLREIMKTNVGPERLEPSLPQETEIHHLRPEAVDEGVVYEVVNELGDKVGELAGSQLAFLVRRAVELDLNELLNAIEDGVVVLDREGRICYENEAYSRIIGVPMRKTIGRDMHVIEPDALLLRVLESGKPDARKWHRIKSVGKYVSMRMFPVWRNGVVAGAFSIFRDVTELNRLGMEVERITQVAEELTSQLDVELSRFQMIGQDPQFRTLLSRAVTAAKTDATVLIRGENGVGKEGFAKLIHQASPRRNRPFITVNCAAIPEALIESELFGYEEGSFTGARKGGKLGKFELAQGGTLFLDEVGDMPLIMQSKLLRVLQGGEIEKVGREENVAVDVRIVAATNQPLEELIEQRRFRADLYYRLNVVPLSIPPLRERQGDILPLAYHFLDRYNERYQKSAVISRGAAQALLSYDWPGNVRQLQNCIESAVILCGQEEIDPADLSLGTIARTVEAAQPAETRQYGTLREETIRFEGQLLRAVLEQCGGDRDETAHRLGISRRTFYRKWSETQP
ncbi:hypothetical protein ADH75_01550 [Flavonifractor plautii]|nr:hypothetical protein A4U99_15825 [Flavonifractor plautii]OXE48288.1 hypothetical protein ADH75_01550 [Flavonifractor plautii]